MAIRQTGFEDLVRDLTSVQRHCLQAERDYDRYVRDAHDAGREEAAAFFEQLRAEDSQRIWRADALLRALTGSSSPKAAR